MAEPKVTLLPRDEEAIAKERRHWIDPNIPRFVSGLTATGAHYRRTGVSHTMQEDWDGERY